MRNIAVLLFIAFASLQAVVFIQGTPLPGGKIGEPYSAAIDIYSDDPNSLTVTLVGGNLPSGISLSSKGLLSGTPTAAGDFNFTIRATDSTGSSTDSKLLRIANTQLMPSSDTFVVAFLGISVNFQVEISGGTPPIFVTRESGSLPPGLSLSSGGRITGTPTALGNYNFRLIVSDSSGRQVAFNQTFRILESPLRISSVNLPRAIVGSLYSFQLTASGGNADTQPTFFRLVSGDLPPGLTWNTEGRIDGTPTAPGTYTARWIAADFSGTTLETPITITVALTNFTLSGSPPPGRVSQPYSFQFSTANGTSPITYNLQSGQLPGGLTLNAGTGLLSGTPTARGSFTATIRARDNAGNQADHTFTIVIEAPPLLITTTTLPNGRMGAPYNARLDASGTPPFTFVVESGGLPRGITLASSGQLSGTPEAPGIFPFTIRAQDASLANARANFRLEIQATPLTFASPNLPKAYANLDYLVRINAQGGAGNITYTARSLLPTGLSLSPDGRLTGRPQQSGQFQLQLRATDGAQQIADTIAALIVEPTPTRLTILESSLPSFTFGLNATARFQATAGAPPYRWSIAKGSLPSGLRLDPPSGQIVGRPLVWGPFTATIRVSDASGDEASWPLEGAVQSPIRPPNASTASPFSFNFAGDFPAGTIFAPDNAVPGRIPAGLTLTREGVLSGTPTVTGIYSFGLLLLSTSGEYSTASVFLTVEPVSPHPIPGATVGVPYQAALDPLTNPQSIVSGVLPPGLTLSSTGRVEGTPTMPGSYSFTARIGAAERYHTIHVLPPGTPVLAAIANAANYNAGPVAPLTLVTAFGQGIGPASLAPLRLDGNQKLSRELDGTRILFDGSPAPLIYASAFQTSAITPVFPLRTFVQIAAEYNGVQSAPLYRLSSPTQIAAFTQDGSGTGPVAALNQDGSLNTAQRPAKRSEVITLFLTGCGDTNPGSLPGDIASAALPLALRTQLSIGGAIAEILYAGSAPGLVVGICQINARVSPLAQSGAQSLTFQIGMDFSNSSAQVFIE